MSKTLQIVTLSRLLDSLESESVLRDVALKSVLRDDGKEAHPIDVITRTGSSLCPPCERKESHTPLPALGEDQT